MSLTPKRVSLLEINLENECRIFLAFFWHEIHFTKSLGIFSLAVRLLIMYV